MSTASIKETLLQEVGRLSPDYYSEALHFVEYLKWKQQPPVSETMLLSESALSKEWETEEEDAAWANL